MRSEDGSPRVRRPRGRTHWTRAKSNQQDSFIVEAVVAIRIRVSTTFVSNVSIRSAGRSLTHPFVTSYHQPQRQQDTTEPRKVPLASDDPQRTQRSSIANARPATS